MTQRPLSFTLTLFALSLLLQGSTLADRRPQAAADEVERTLAAMTVDERIGQLFLVTFEGRSVATGSPIRALIDDYHVGGVVLVRENNNFDDSDPQLESMAALIAELQAVSLEQGGESAVPLPLLVGIDDRANGWPVELLSGSARAASNMALGATWDANFAYETGEVVGAEMAASGVNMMMGPNADVVEIPLPLTSGDQGARVFGGDAYWVSRMVQAYVEGVHMGSQGQVLVFPRHFPGYGASDRLPSVEVPTVRRTQDSLAQSDLKPFYAVTADIPGVPAVADGLITGHVRYLGFQGDNPRQPTRPISLDAAALPALLAEEPLLSWRASGGLLISDALGLNGVKRFYDPSGQTFLNRRVAQDALLAGNDMLYMGFIGDTVGQDETAIIQDTMEFLVQSYVSDAAVRASVDASVRRILTAKQRIYGTLDPTLIAARMAEERPATELTDLTLQVAQESLTLLSPTSISPLPIPRLTDSIVVFTDTRSYARCATCLVQGRTNPNGFEAALVRLYGPESSGLVSGATIESYSLLQLEVLLEFGPLAQATPEEGAEATAAPDPILIALSNADWLVFLVGDGPESQTALSTLRGFLATTPYIAEETQVVVFAMGAPYYLDSTEVGKLSAYFALYDASPSALELAARALFQQTPVRGASPVSIPGIDYSISEATSPDPNQIIPLSYTVEGQLELAPAVGTETPAPTATFDPTVRLGATLRIDVGPILDRNGNLVPDGTPVDLVLSYSGDGLRGVIPLTTVDGIAQDTVLLDRAGALQISAVSEPARNSATVQLSIPETGGATISVVTPEIAVTPTEALPPTPIPTVTEAGGEEGGVDTALGIGDLFFTLAGLAILGYLRARRWYLAARWNEAFLQSLPILICGLLAYHVVGLQPPGIAFWFGLMGDFLAAPVAAWLGGMLGILLVETLERNRGVRRRSQGSTTRQRRG